LNEFKNYQYSTFHPNTLLALIFFSVAILLNIIISRLHIILLLLCFLRDPIIHCTNRVSIAFASYYYHCYHRRHTWFPFGRQKQYTLLMCAARNNRLSVVNFLLDTIDDVGLDAFDTDHQTALHHAAIAGHTHVVRRLVHAGANTSTTNKVSFYFFIFFY